jgi:hypothetical protein
MSAKTVAVPVDCTIEAARLQRLLPNHWRLRAVHRFGADRGDHAMPALIRELLAWLQQRLVRPALVPVPVRVRRRG